MNELNKLIEQYPGDKIRLGLAFLETKKDPYYWSVQLQEFLKFIRWLATRPTCGKEQRKFLDDVEKGRYNPDGIETGLHIGRYTVIWPSDTIADLQKVVQGE